MKAKHLFLAVFLIACVVSFGSIWRVFAEKSEYREFYKGNVDAELDAYTAGLNFARHGFTKLYFLPAMKRYEESFDALMKQGLYTHYPPGPYLVSGAMQDLGIHGFYPQKAWILSLNLIALLLLASAIRRILPNEQAVAPFILVSMALTSVWFVWWAGNLHDHAYHDLFTALGVWAVVANKERFYLFTCFIALLFSFEPVPWLGVVGVFMAAQKIMAKTWSPKQALVFVAAMIGAFFLAFGIHLVQNACYFQSFSVGVADLRNTFLNRTGTVAGDYAYSAAKHFTKAVYSSLWFFGTGVLILAGIGLRTSIRRRLWLPVVLLCAGLAWQVVFRYHSMFHGFMMRHFGIGLFVLATIGFLYLWEQSAWKKSLALLLLFAAMLRLPLGCELSKNPLFLTQLHKVVTQTDSATIADLIYFFKDNPEHVYGKKILIDELAMRGHALPDQTAYTIVMNGKPLTLVRDEQGQSIWYRNLPKDRTPVFHDSVFPYLDAAGPRKKVPYSLRSVVLADQLEERLAKAGAPIELAITGNRNKVRYRLLLAVLLLQ